MIDIAELETYTRSIIVYRARNMIDHVGYYLNEAMDRGGRMFYQSPLEYTYLLPSGRSMITTSVTPYIATDCSAWCSYCWNLHSRHTSRSWKPGGTFSSRFHYPTNPNGKSVEEKFGGIQPGDVLWKDGHVAPYIGDNLVADVYTSWWGNTANGHGGAIRPRYSDFEGYVSWTASWSDDYDPDNPLGTDEVWDDSDQPPIIPPEGGIGVNDPDEIPIVFDQFYTKRRSNMKLYRTI